MVIDAIIIIFIIIAILRGYFSGLIVQSATIIALLGGYLASTHFYKPFGSLLHKHFDISTKISHYVGFAILFIVVIILVQLISFLATKFIEKSILSTLNRFFGVLLSVLKTVFVLSIVFFLIQKFDTHEKFIKPNWKSDSYLYKPVVGIAPFILPDFDTGLIKKKLLNQ